MTIEGKRDWFDPNIITPTDGTNYYIRLTNLQYFPFISTYQVARNWFKISPTAETIDITRVLMCSEII